MNGGERIKEIRGVARAAGSDTPLVTNFTGWKGLAAHQVIGASGHRYTILVDFTRRPLVGLISDLGYKTWLDLLAILAVGGLFYFWLARHIANPIAQLNWAAGRIADLWLDARSDQKVRVRRDEIGRPGLSFDRMAERIESLVQGRQRLFGYVSHELRSPLARLSVAEGLLRQCPPEEREEFRPDRSRNRKS